MAVLNIRGFPDNLIHDLKVRAATERKTLRELVIELLRGAVVMKARGK